MVSRVRHESENSDLWNASTADTHYIQGEGGEKLLVGVKNRVSDIVRTCGQVCTCASNTVMRVAFAICGFKG